MSEEKSFFYSYDFVKDDDGCAKVFEVDMYEEYGAGDYTVEIVDEHGRHSVLLAVSTHGQVRLPEVKDPEPTKSFIPGQVFNSFQGTDVIVKKDGEILPYVVWIQLSIAIDDSVPGLRAGIFREKTE